MIDISMLDEWRDSWFQSTPVKLRGLDTKLIIIALKFMMDEMIYGFGPKIFLLFYSFETNCQGIGRK